MVGCNGRELKIASFVEFNYSNKKNTQKGRGWIVKIHKGLFGRDWCNVEDIHKVIVGRHIPLNSIEKV